jgi:hypothetical protein
VRLLHNRDSSDVLVPALGGLNFQLPFQDGTGMQIRRDTWERVREDISTLTWPSTAG